METVSKTAHHKNQQRTAIVYFGAEREDYLKRAEADDPREFLDFVQQPLRAQLGAEKHRDGCPDLSRYTGHSKRSRSLHGWSGPKTDLPIRRVRCCGCRTVFTVLPSFVCRYRRQDSDCLAKLLTLSLSMDLSQRQTALIYSWGDAERCWTPGWVWSLLQWLGTLLPVSWLLLRLGLTPPESVLSDEKFAHLDGLNIYLFTVSQGELIWYIQKLEQVTQAAFEPAIAKFLATVNQEAHTLQLISEDEVYAPTTVTTDGWEQSQGAWRTESPNSHLLECRWHGRNRIDSSLEDYQLNHPDVAEETLNQLKKQIAHLWAAPSRAKFSQRLRRLREAWGDDKVLSRRFEILKKKRFLFTEYLNFPEASPYLAPLDRSLRFLDEKLQTFGQFRQQTTVDITLNAWAIVNNMRSFLPDAKRAGQSLAEIFGAKIQGLPWMEAVNLCTVGQLSDLLPATGSG